MLDSFPNQLIIDDLEIDESLITDEHSVIIQFNHGIEVMEDVHTLERRFYDGLLDPEIGKCDGHELGMDINDGRLYFYGPNAEILFKEIHPHLKDVYFLKGAVAILKFGNVLEDAPEIEIDI